MFLVFLEIGFQYKIENFLMKLKEYQEGRPTILRHWPISNHWPGEIAEVQEQDLVCIRRKSDLLADVYAHRVITMYHSKPEPEGDHYETNLKESAYGVDKLHFYFKTSEGKFFQYRSIDTALVFKAEGKALASIMV